MQEGAVVQKASTSNSSTTVSGIAKRLNTAPTPDATQVFLSRSLVAGKQKNNTSPTPSSVGASGAFTSRSLPPQRDTRCVFTSHEKSPSIPKAGFVDCVARSPIVPPNSADAPKRSLDLSSFSLSSFSLSSFSLSSFSLSSFSPSSFPLSSFPLSSFPPSSFPPSSFPPSSFPPSSFPPSSFPLSSFPLSSFPLSSFPPSSFPPSSFSPSSFSPSSFPPSSFSLPFPCFPCFPWTLFSLFCPLLFP